MPKRAIKKELTLQEQADEILKQAKERGLEQNFFFVTTFDRYLQQLAILEELQAVIKDNDSLITQTYVKGRDNKVLNPAIRAYNSTADSANKTVGVLLKIINGCRDDEDSPSNDPLLKIINGGK